MGIHRYIITINAAPQKPITYTYKYGNPDGNELKVSKQKAIVESTSDRDSFIGNKDANGGCL